MPVTSRNYNAPILDEGRQQILGTNDLGVDAWGRQKVVIDHSVVHAMATFDISPKVWFVDENNVELSRADLSTRVTSKMGGFNVTSGGTLNDTTTLRGKRHPRYQPNRGWLFSTAGVLFNKGALGTRRFGGVTEESGIFFELTEGILYATVRQSVIQRFTATASQTLFNFTDGDILASSTVYVRVKQATGTLWVNTTSFSVNTTANTVTLGTASTVGDIVTIIVVNDVKEDLTSALVRLEVDIEKETLYDIQSQWRGAGDISFFINLKLVYTFRNLGVHSRTSISNPALPIYFSCTNGGEETSMLMGCADITSEGGREDKLEYVSIANKPQVQVPVVSISSPDKVLLVVYSPTYYKGSHNTRDLHILRVGASTDANAFLNIYVTRNPTWLTTTLLLKDPLDGSAVLYDNALNSTNTAVRDLGFDITSGRLVTSLRVAADTYATLDNPNQYKIEYTLTHGDYLVLTGNYEKVGTANMLATVEIGEEV
jgi:hypothetical protein